MRSHSLQPGTEERKLPLLKVPLSRFEGSHDVCCVFATSSPKDALGSTSSEEKVDRQESCFSDSLPATTESLLHISLNQFCLFTLQPELKSRGSMVQTVAVNEDKTLSGRGGIGLRMCVSVSVCVCESVCECPQNGATFANEAMTSKGQFER